MKVTFVFPDWVDVESTVEHDKKGFGIGHFHFGIATLSAVLKDNGIETDLLHITCRPEETAFKKTIKEKTNSEIFAFSFTQVEYEWVKEMNKWIKEVNTELFTIGGGTYPTLFPLNALRDIRLDAVCIGEGEKALLKLCRSRSRNPVDTEIKNIWFYRENNIIKNPTGEITEDLDDLPKYDYDLFRPEKLKIFSSNLPRIYYLCTRNCVYGCRFCSNHAKRKAYNCGKSYVRKFSPQRVINDLKYYLEKFPMVKVVHFADEIIHFDKPWFKDLMTLYKKEIDLPWRSYAMLKNVDTEVADIMKKSNCTRVNCGIEAGTQRIRDLYNRPRISNEQIIKRIKLLRENSIDVHSSTLLNAPTEKLNEMLDTIKLAAKSGTDIALTGIVVPYPGTKLHKIAHETRLFNNLKVENTGVSIMPADTTEEKVLFLFAAYRLLVETYKFIYRQNKAVQKITIPILDSLIKSRYLPHKFLISMREKYFKGRILNLEYRRTETSLGRQEKDLQEAVKTISPAGQTV